MMMMRLKIRRRQARRSSLSAVHSNRLFQGSFDGRSDRVCGNIDINTTISVAHRADLGSNFTPKTGTPCNMRPRLHVCPTTNIDVVVLLDAKRYVVRSLISPPRAAIGIIVLAFKTLKG